MAAWIKMSVGMKLGRGQGDFVLDGDHAPPPPKKSAPFLRPNGWMDEAGTWHGGRPQHRRLCVRWGPSSPPPKGGGAPSPIFGPFLLDPNGWMHEDASWYGCRPQPRGLCVRWRPSYPPQKGGGVPTNFRPMFIVAKRPGHIVLDGDPAPLPKRRQSPQFSAHIYCGQTAVCIKMPLGMEVDLSPGDFVLDGVPAPAKGAQ